MDEKGVPVPPKADAAATATEDGTPSRPRQAGSGNSRKQPRAAKQLRFEAPVAGDSCVKETTSVDAEAQADLAPEHPPADEYGYPPYPNPPMTSFPKPRSLNRPATEAAHASLRDMPVGSGSDGSQPKRRKRTSSAKQKASAAGYGQHGGYGYYAGENGSQHIPKAKSKPIHRAPKQDDKGPCLNPACRTTDTPQWRLGPMFCRELCNRCGTRWQRAKNTRNPQGFFVWVRNDLRSQGLEVPDAVARPAASPDLAMAALREVENQPHAGRQHKAEEVEISEDDEVIERAPGRRYQDDMMQEPDEESDVSAPEVVPHHRNAMRRPQPRPHHDWLEPKAPLTHPSTYHKGHRSHQRAHTDHYQEAAMRMADLEDGAHPNETREDEDDSGASEADLLCSEVLSESHDEGSDVGSDALYRRRYNHHSAQMYEDAEDESGLSAEEADEEVAVTKRGRHVKMPAKYKAELQTEQHHRKRKAEDSPDGGSRGRVQRPYPNSHPADWGHRPVSALYDVQRAQRGGLQPSTRAGHGLGSPSGRSSATKSPQGHKAAKYIGTKYPSQQHRRPYPSAQLDEADTEAVDALMGMTGLLYAH